MAEPVTLELAKQQLRVDGTSQDDLIISYIVAARTFVEGQTGLALIPDDARVEYFSRFARALELGCWPVREIVSVGFIDAQGADQVLADDGWRAAYGRRPATITPAVAASWPVALCGPDAITVTFKAGYEAPDQVPGDIRQAILLLIRHWFDNPSAVMSGATAGAIEVPLGVGLILHRYRLRRV